VDAVALNVRGLEDEEQWMTNLREGDNLKMARYAGKKMRDPDTRTPEELRAAIRDPNAAPQELTQAIWRLRETNKENMLVLAELLDDETPQPVLKWSPRYMDESYPLANHRAVRKARESWIKQREKGPGTIGDAAEIQLNLLANQGAADDDQLKRGITIKVSFGKDAEAWRKWINSNVR